MNHKRLGQVLLAGVFALCGAAITGLMELVKRNDGEPEKTEAARPGQPVGHSPKAGGHSNQMKEENRNDAVD